MNTPNGRPGRDEAHQARRAQGQGRVSRARAQSVPKPTSTWAAAGLRQGGPGPSPATSPASRNEGKRVGLAASSKAGGDAAPSCLPVSLVLVPRATVPSRDTGLHSEVASPPRHVHKTLVQRCFPPAHGTIPGSPVNEYWGNFSSFGNVRSFLNSRADDAEGGVRAVRPTGCGGPACRPLTCAGRRQSAASSASGAPRPPAAAAAPGPWP